MHLCVNLRTLLLQLLPGTRIFWCSIRSNTKFVKYLFNSDNNNENDPNKLETHHDIDLTPKTSTYLIIFVKYIKFS